MPTSRRLTVLVSLDVTGFTRLVQQDERATLAGLAAIRRDLMDATLQRRNGHIFKTMGDGALIDFPNVEDAVSWTVEFQEAMAARNLEHPENPILVRAGIALGDVYFEGEDRFGAAIAAVVRLQEFAPAGGIAMTHSVRWQLGKALRARFTRVVETLKGFDELWEIWIWPSSSDGDASAANSSRPSEERLSIMPDKPSLAVLPFQNMSGDPEQEYFADGVVEDIIMAFSRIRWLFVIARNSSFTYKGRAVDVKQIGRELGVRYVLEGSVRKAVNRIRITGQLVDAATGVHLWADRFEGGLEDIFELQDQVTASVVGAIGPRLEQAEIERARRKPTENLDAYDYFLRGMAALHRWSREANDEALRLFSQAIELDPEFASAYGMAARCYSQRKASGWMTNRTEEVAETERLARRAAALGKDDAVALCTAGIAFSYVLGEHDHGAALMERGLALNPNWASAWLFSGWGRVWLGEPEVAIEHVARAMRLSPQDPQIFNAQAAMASAHFFASRYVEASSWAEMAVREQPNHFIATCVAAASNALTTRLPQAQKAMASLRQLDPDLRLSNLKDLFPIRRLDDFAKWTDGMRRAGLPE